MSWPRGTAELEGGVGRGTLFQQPAEALALQQTISIVLVRRPASLQCAQDARLHVHLHAAGPPVLQRFLERVAIALPMLCKVSGINQRVAIATSDAQLHLPCGLRCHRDASRGATVKASHENLYCTMSLVAQTWTHDTSLNIT